MTEPKNTGQHLRIIEVRCVGAITRFQFASQQLALCALQCNGLLYDHGAAFCRSAIALQPHLRQPVSDALLRMLDSEKATIE